MNKRHSVICSSPVGRLMASRLASWAMAGLAVAAITFAACGGDDDDSEPPPDTATATAEPGGGATSSEGEPATDGDPTSDEGEEPTGTTGAGEGEGDGDAPEGAPTPADENFPDVYGDLAPGSSLEADAGEDPESGSPARVRVTIDDIRESAEPGVPAQLYEVPEGFRLWVADLTVESIGEGALPTAVIILATSDGTEYETLIGLEVGTDLFYFDLPPGETASGVAVFEIPEDASVAWLLVDPNIYVGSNLVFLAGE